jgi:hypothetical protein
MKGISKLVEKVLPKKEFIGNMKRNIKGRIIPYFLAGSLALGTMYGCKKEKIEPIPLPNNPPTTYLSVNPTSGEAPLEARIKGSISDEDGSQDIKKKYTLRINGADVIKKTDSSTLDTTLIFSTPGKYNLEGIGWDKQGASDTAKVVLNVSEKPIPENNPPIAIVSADPSQGEAPLTSRIKVSGSDEDGVEDIKKYYLEIGKLGIGVERTNPIDTNLVFSDYGDYNIRGIVEDKSGARDTLEVLLNVLQKNPSVTQSVSLKDYVRINYNLNFENTSGIQLDIIKEGEKILSKNISNSGHSEIFDYFSDDNFTKGFYEFVANFKTNAGKDTSIVGTVEIPNYNPEVDWSGLNLNFDENSSTSVNLPNPKDKNPEDNPVNYIPESFSSDKAYLEFNSENNELKIEGMPNRYGSYDINAEFGSDEGGFGTVQKQGTINEVLYQGYNPFATPNLFGQGEINVEGKTRSELLQILDEKNMQDSSWTWQGNQNFQCGSFSRLKCVNMFGCKNLEEWDSYFIFENALENNNIRIMNGRFNIPVYRVRSDVDPDHFPDVDPNKLYGHQYNGVWVGPDNYVETRDDTDFDQWVFFDPQFKGENGTYYVQPGDWQMDDNGQVSIYWFGYTRSSLSGEWSVKDKQILQYQLTDGKAELDPGFSQDGINDRLITEDPYQ